MTLRPLCLALALAFAAPLAVPAAQAQDTATEPAIDKARQLDALYAGYWEEMLQLYPLRATQVGDSRYNDRLPNTYTDEFRAKEKEFTRRWLARAEAIGPDGLEGQARLS
jgi:uncharacterized protein (DUF885 family)